MPCDRYPLRNDLPPPFTEAKALLVSHTGHIAIIDDNERTLAHVPLAVAYTLAADDNKPPAIRCSIEHRGFGYGAANYGMSQTTGSGYSIIS
jgi:hypothetical protein